MRTLCRYWLSRMQISAVGKGMEDENDRQGSSTNAIRLTCPIALLTGKLGGGEAMYVGQKLRGGEERLQLLETRNWLLSRICGDVS
jgi:hypothetical protein